MTTTDAPGTRSALLAASSIVVLWLASPEPTRPQPFPADDACTLFSGAALISFAGDEVDAPTPDQDVLVCGTRIRAVGPSGSLEVPEGATRVDASGKVLMPGLFDGHVHLFAPLDLDLNLAWGVTGVRNLFGNAFALNTRAQIEQGAIVGPRFFTAGPIVDGDPPIWPGSDAVTTAEAARETVAKQAEAGYDFVKVYSLLRPDPFFAAIEAAHERGLMAGGHVPGSVPLEDATARGMDFIEHLTGFLPAAQRDDSPYLALTPDERRATDRYEITRLQVEGFDPEKLPTVAGWMVEHGVWNIPTFVVIERITASAAQKQEWVETHPQMRYVSGPTLSFWNPNNDFRLQDVSEEQLAARARSAALHAPIVKALHEAGAELMLGTDTPNPFVFPGYSVHEELQRFVEAGLTPWQALRAATVQPARFLGQEEVFGRVAPGLEADLLLLDANPLEAIENTERVAGVMTRGRWLDRAALDAKLAAVAKAYGKE
ncbi:MAG: hypothetical protein DWQ36_13645 [Acidobacteria bacterium]|nr:MAG: hypothetical protein DWQ30_20310 [Acidobacteriota bacterium]REK06253.1 MAG: hypothetical protein DWQ36_13645 [Acidobacteriota bacterium]